ncbi:MAG: hypothetical protein COB98_01150 [Flavobacteriaceae bacterium]|nr:MAG: hypothetical protein COB98_01150 [Flavobacteriaceae bacterium]
MKKLLKYGVVLLLGMLLSYSWFGNQENSRSKEEVQLLRNSIKHVSKLVVTEVEYSQIFNYSDAKKYFFETISFEKKVVLLVRAKVQVMYDLKLMETQLDTLGKIIYINKIPAPEVVISPRVRYFDFQQSSFNEFDTKELNRIHTKCIANIKNSITLDALNEKARKQLMIELKQLYQLSNLLGWQLVDNSDSKLFETFLKNKPIY